MATLVDLYRDTLPGLIGTRYQTYGDELLHGWSKAYASNRAEEAWWRSWEGKALTRESMDDWPSATIESGRTWYWAHDPDKDVAGVSDVRCTVYDLQRHSGDPKVFVAPVQKYISWRELTVDGAYTTAGADADPLAERLALDGKTSSELGLRLTKPFLLARATFLEGRLPELNKGFHRLETHAASALVLAFGYELRFPTDPDVKVGLSEFTWEEDLSKDLRGKTRIVTPIPPGLLSLESFMGKPTAAERCYSNDPAAARAALKADAAAAADDLTKGAYATRNPTIVVFLTFTFCKPHDDFFGKGSPYDVCRLYPHAMVISSHPLRRMRAKCEMERPARTHKHFETRTNDEARDGITHDYHPLLASDTNDTWQPFGFEEWVGGLPVPLWPNMFDRVAPVSGSKKFTAVRRATNHAAGAWKKSLTRRLRYYGPSTKMIDWVPLAGEGWGFYNNERTSEIAYRQGEYDNLHTAPAMVAPSAILDAMPDDAWRESLSKIAMAPFCVHDCFHTHWRWSAPTGTTAGIYFHKTLGPENKGWGAKGPNTEPDAPMVPHNQQVVVECEGGKFTYTATAFDVAPLEWQVFFHHGSGYAVSIDKGTLGTFDTIRGADLAVMFNGAFLAVPPTPALFSDSEMVWSRGTDPARHARLKEIETGSWAMLYWHLRWTISPEGYVLPRLDEVSGGF